jgi:ribosomal protein S18 acetylase RimI-like enzyme
MAGCGLLDPLGPMIDATIRRAQPSDAKQLSIVAEATFRQTFAAHNSREDMEVFCASAYGEAVPAREIANPAMTTLLAQAGDELVGFAQLRWGTTPACVPATAAGEIQRLYVVREFHGKGIAQMLMEACLQSMVGRGSDVVWLGVWERNPKAIAFYRKFGFIEVGEHVFRVGNDPQRDIVMARRLVDP